MSNGRRKRNQKRLPLGRYVDRTLAHRGANVEYAVRG